MTRSHILFFFLIGLLLIKAEPFLSAQVYTDPRYAPQQPEKQQTVPIPGAILRNPTRSEGDLKADDLIEEESDAPRSYRPGGYTPGLGTWRPNMTREEIVRQRQLEALRRDAKSKEATRKLLRDFQVRQDSIDYLLGDQYLPQVLKKPDPQALETLENEFEKQAIPAPSHTPAPTQTENRNEDPLEKEEPFLTEEQILEKEYQEHLKALEELQDPNERLRQRQAIERRIEARRRWLEKRAEAERGADFFQITPQTQLTDEMLKEGWCNLFDGSTLFGWRTQKEGPYAGGRFTVARRELRSDPEHPGLLYTTSQFGDMTLMFDYYAEPDSEAYLLLRTSPNPRDLNTSCYAVVLCSNDFRKARGSVLGRTQVSTEHLRSQAANRDIERGPRWRSMRVMFDGTRLDIRVDSTEAYSFYEMQPLGHGYVGLLVAKGDVRFRNMHWKPGSSLPIFDGITPEMHWRYKADGIQVTTTRDLALQLNNGPGVIESKDHFDDFILQLEYNIAYTSSRTALFFRSTPSADKSGYEVSIQNFPTREDRDKFLGVDVGSFRNRKSGRYVRPEDQKWNYLTLVAIDRHFQTWVNGIPACETSDRRSIAEASADGPFLGAGPLQLMAPDTGTEVQFRNLRVTPIPQRHPQLKKPDSMTKSTWEAVKKEWDKNDRERKELEEQKKGKK